MSQTADAKPGGSPDGFLALELTPGQSWRQALGQAAASGAASDLWRDLEPPTRTVAFLERAGGVLNRTLYALRRGGQDAFAVGIARPHTAQLTLGVLAGPAALAPHLAALARDRAFGVGLLSVKVRLPAAAATSMAWDEVGFERLRPPAMGAASGDTAEPVQVGLASRAWGKGERAAELAYCRQSTEITCGPAALLMVLERLGLCSRPDRSKEIDLWRQATTMPGCDPYGLALAAARIGATPEVTASVSGTMFNQPGEPAWQRAMRDLVQQEFRDRARDAGVTARVEDFGVGELRRQVASGRLVMLLIDEALMHGAAVPHWIVAHGHLDGPNGGHFLVDDPWFDDQFGETWVDAHELVIPAADLDQMARWGDDPYRAMVVFDPAVAG
jgi:hypothetical protein